MISLNRNDERRGGLQRGFTLVELVIAVVLVNFLLLAVTLSIQHDARAMRELASITHAELKAKEMLQRVEAELVYAQAVEPIAWLTASLDATEFGAVGVDRTSGFPDVGMLLLDRGTASEERLSYSSFSSSQTRFLVLDRGLRCDEARFHPEGGQVLWAPSAVHIANQSSPPSSLWDGVARELSSDVYFLGDGSGFCYRVPVDPDGGSDYFEGSQVRWGAEVEGTPTTDGYMALYFAEVSQLSEASRGFDFNRDGDLEDEFRLGRIRRRSWDASDANRRATDVALCPAVVIVDACDWKADLDADGFQDPMFLWDPVTGRLRIRLFILAGSVNQQPIVRRLESILYIRNGTRG